MTTTPPSQHLKASKFMSFAAVGGLATALHWGVAAALLWLTGMNPVLASTIGFVASAGFNLVANARFTFKATAVTGSHVIRFGVSSSSGCVLNAVVMQLALQAGLPVALCQMLATALVLIWNFLMNALWVFRQPKDTPVPEPSR
jgi:putative flippase GtrA